ncbi:zinc finger protein [Amycolatopsis jejuensis]|uniref:zinc finger protein n=1 Tax=Amycolatopsis jejuensis TaxID=330084 RepID=UPI000525F993|nr:zinc finger protein [Amycolatopsis jejuensis]
MFKWQQAEGKRHALEGPFAPRPEETFTALCGAEVTVARSDVPQLGGHWFDPTCPECAAEWLRRAEALRAELSRAQSSQVERVWCAV